MLSRLDLLFIVASLVLMATGFARRHKMWRLGDPAGDITIRSSKGWRRLILSIFRPRRFTDNLYENIAHLFIFWGFIIPLAIVLISQFRPILPAWAGHSISFLLDLIGLLAIAGTVMLLAKKFLRGNMPAGRRSIPLWILLAILITGFIAEGLRLSITADGPGNAHLLFSPIGFALSKLLPESPLFFDILIRLHFYLVLFFIAYMPFSVMRHAWASLFGLYHQENSREAAIRPIALEGDYFGTGAVEDFSRIQLMDSDACMSCGRCDENCPAHISGKPLRPRGVINEIGRQMEAAFQKNGAGGKQETGLLNTAGRIGQEDIWSCTTCLACVNICPIFARHVTDIVGLRRYAVLMKSQFPSEYKQLFKHMETFGDTFGIGSCMREEWTSGLNPARVYEDNEVDFLFWVGCSGALYEDRTRAKTLAAATILKRAGVSFGILGKEEACCGDPARRLGNEYLFQRLANRNIETLKSRGIKKIITSCPHCFHVLRNEYHQFGGDFEVIHLTQLLKDLFKEGRLTITSPSRSLLTYHDPCYLGRYNGIYDQPRELLGLLLESNVREMAACGNNSFCCGAGGGAFWCGKTTGRRIEEIRIEQAIATGAEGLVTACPFCEILFESAVRQMGADQSFKVVDIVQLVLQLTESN